ncbi:MAG TPA: hypothetical protein VFT83_03945 [Nitrososphaeraceae archaeon]|nr:hypothetical protein [Nitrososphaeraceae archaeon]HSF50047.1 hypothetical protein [Nitrososphaeraceae archaeon]
MKLKTIINIGDPTDIQKGETCHVCQKISFFYVELWENKTSIPRTRICSECIKYLNLKFAKTFESRKFLQEVTKSERLLKEFLRSKPS